LDRTTGEFLFAEPYTNVNWTQGLDPKTGKPVEYNPSALVQDYGPGKSVRAGVPETGQNVCPNWIGSPTLMPPTFDQRRMVAYVAAATGCFSSGVEAPYERVDIEVGQERSFPGLTLISHGQQEGRIVGVNVLTGEQVVEATAPWPFYSGTLGTDGDLLFTAQIDGKIIAADKDTLTELWSFNVGTPISAPPVTYAIDGRQYVAIAVGGALYRPSDFNTREPLTLQRNAQIVVFGL
jgi:alcohol dehydrogenase (cytochrome c)